MEDRPVTPPTVLPRSEHPLSRKLIDPDALWILQKLRREGHLAYLVGGAVRDLLLGREPKDFDIGTDARPSEIRRLFRNSRLIGRRFRLAHVYFRRKGEPEKIVEVSTFRSLQRGEVPDDIPPEDLDLTGSVFGTPEEDAWRRDFTVNALFYNLDDFSIVDHVGGLRDLEGGILRLIGTPDERFDEDPVRMLRAIEFAVRLGFRIEERTAEGIRRNASLLANASPARLREELRQMEERGIVAPVLAEAHRLGLLEVLLPEVEETEGMFPLLELLDERAAAGRPAPEWLYVAALVLPTVASRYPLAPGADLERAQEVAAERVDSLTARYQISAHVRHQARDLLLSLYRLARGKAYRTKGRFVKKPEFQDAWAFLQAWAHVVQDLGDVVAYWEDYLGGTAPERKPGEGRPRRRRRRRRGPAREAAPAAE